jgi:hypothetical protein
MLAMLVLASLVVPGVVAARQTVDPVAAAAAPVTPAPDDDLGVLAEQAESNLGPSGVACYLRTCTNRAQCQLWCDDPGATCAPSETLPHYKFCMLQ